MVTAVWVHDDTLVDLVLEDGVTVTATEDHPFWNETDQQWQQAEAVDPGGYLLTADGRTITVTGHDWDTATTETACNRTVANLHTYYVLAGDTPVLVHNQNGGIDLSDAIPWQGRSPVGGSVDAGGPPNGFLYRTQNGVVSNYAVNDVNGGILRRVDLMGAAHGGVPTPHFQEYTHHKTPDGRVFPRQNRTARPLPDTGRVVFCQQLSEQFFAAPRGTDPVGGIVGGRDPSRPVQLAAWEPVARGWRHPPVRPGGVSPAAAAAVAFAAEALASYLSVLDAADSQGLQ